MLLFVTMHMRVILLKMCKIKAASLKVHKKYQSYSNIIEKYISLAEFLVGKSWNLVVYFNLQIVVPQYIFTFG